MTRAGSASGGAGGDGGGEASEDELDEADPSLAEEAGPSRAGEAGGVDAGDRASDGERACWSRAGVELAPEAALGEVDASACGAGPGALAEACRGGVIEGAWTSIGGGDAAETCTRELTTKPGALAGNKVMS